MGGTALDTSSLIKRLGYDGRLDASRRGGNARRAASRAGVRPRRPGFCGVFASSGLGDDLEHPHHLLHAADGARQLGGARGLALGDAAHQVDDAALA